MKTAQAAIMKKARIMMTAHKGTSRNLYHNRSTPSSMKSSHHNKNQHYPRRNVLIVDKLDISPETAQNPNEEMYQDQHSQRPSISPPHCLKRKTNSGKTTNGVKPCSR